MRVYVVVGTCGEYSDKVVWNAAVMTTRGAAEAYVFGMSTPDQDAHFSIDEWEVSDTVERAAWSKSCRDLLDEIAGHEKFIERKRNSRFMEDCIASSKAGIAGCLIKLAAMRYQT